MANSFEHCRLQYIGQIWLDVLNVASILAYRTVKAEEASLQREWWHFGAHIEVRTLLRKRCALYRTRAFSRIKFTLFIKCFYSFNTLLSAAGPLGSTDVENSASISVFPQSTSESMPTIKQIATNLTSLQNDPFSSFGADSKVPTESQILQTSTSSQLQPLSSTAPKLTSVDGKQQPELTAMTDELNLY